MDYKDMALKDICLLPGVADIKPLLARAKFGQALKVESAGDPNKAETLLNEAVALEQH